MRKIYSIGVIKWGVIPFSLLIIWFVLSLVIVPHKSITVVTQSFVQSNKNYFSKKVLKNGEKMFGSFTSNYNNLGIIELNLQPLTNKSGFTNSFAFRLKEQGSDKWYYNNIYVNGFFNHLPFAPVGFGTIANSKNKSYTFEVEALEGNQNIPIKISSERPAYIAVYKYSLKSMLHDLVLFRILIDNIFSLFSEIQFLSYSTIFLLPLIAYLYPMLINLFTSKYAPKSRVQYGIGITLLLFFLIDTFIISVMIYGIFLGFLAIILTATVKNKISSNILLISSGIFFLISIMLLIAGQANQANKVSAWVYCLFTIGMGRIAWDFRKLLYKT